MNSRAKMLGMNGTVYTDCTGMGEGNVTTAKDTALLCSELAKYKISLLTLPAGLTL